MFGEGEPILLMSMLVGSVLMLSIGTIINASTSCTTKSGLEANMCLNIFAI